MRERLSTRQPVLLYVDGRVIAPATALESAAEWSGAIGT